MKTHYVVLVLFSLLFVTACCNKDDDNNNQPQQVEFTSTNYIYEGDLRKFYLETENTRLNDSIAVWQQIPDSDPNYNDAQGNIAQATATIVSNNQEAGSILIPGDAFLIINPVFPPIPPPSPCFGICIPEYNSIRHIVSQLGNDIIGISITSVENQSTLVSTNANTQINIIPNTNGLGKYQSFELSQNNFTGQAIIDVQTTNGNYSVLSDFHNLE